MMQTNYRVCTAALAWIWCHEASTCNSFWLYGWIVQCAWSSCRVADWAAK